MFLRYVIAEMSRKEREERKANGKMTGMDRIIEEICETMDELEE